ncbi:metal ABC transporter solute-binding protein, Zn/Mn family [Oricola sp.]|uniref:metal ABC transporter solute-binding protein, Zn/Mn family n=1 Tax=Oricola sp. TaxID=1979950 RepID=UPI003BAAF88F
MSLKRPVASISATALAAILMAAPANADSVKAVSTIGMIADVVANVGGECVDSITLMGAGVDPHLYQASANDVKTFQAADVIFYSGYSLEGQLGDVLANISERVPTVALSPASIEPANLITVEDIYGIDPHLWMDANLWAKTVPTIAEALKEANAGCGTTIDANAEAYAGKLLALHDWVAASIATVPEGQRVLVTAHDAFGYYGRAYGLDEVGIQGISTESEASIADIRATVDSILERKVPAVFVESTINPRTINAVIDAAKNEGHDVVVGGELFSDAMGEDGTVGGTYIGMIYENTVSITTALGGTPLPLPAELKAWGENWELAAAE